jgi:riboflavin kinase/FMN adenylyltransferase
MTERGSLVAIGNFDGVHLGHQAVLEASAEEAHRKQVLALALTFHPHPAVVLGRPHTVLTEISRKVELICRIDPELQVVVQPFTTELAAKSPREFVVELLLAKLHAKLVVVGENFRFGHARAGNLSLLSELGRELGFETRAQTLSQDETVGVYSSSRAREAISAGDLARAEAILGRPHSVSGIVILGDQRGRRLGVPTANLSGVSEVLPPFGAYACVVDRVSKDGVAQALGKAMLNIGIRPTAKAGYSIERGTLARSLHLTPSRGNAVRRSRRAQRAARPGCPARPRNAPGARTGSACRRRVVLISSEPTGETGT